MNMKMIVSSVIVSIGLIAAPTVASAQEALAKSSGCLNCHDVTAKKMGPAFKEIATKYKGNADAAATLEAKLTGAKGHPAVKASADDVKSLVKWILAM
jgi:cytochrome c